MYILNRNIIINCSNLNWTNVVVTLNFLTNWCAWFLVQRRMWATFINKWSCSLCRAYEVSTKYLWVKQADREFKLNTQQITSSLFEKKYYVEILKSELNSTRAYAPAELTKDKHLLQHTDSLTKSNIKIDKTDLPIFYWLPKLHKTPYKSRFISNSSHSSTTILSKHMTSALTAVKDHVIKYSETAFCNSNVNYFLSIENSSDVIEMLLLRNFPGSQISSFWFFCFIHILAIWSYQRKVFCLVKWCFNRESKTYLCTSDKAGFLQQETWLV